MMIRIALTPTPAKSYFICSTPRTGSNLLSESLEYTRLAGNPKEYFDSNFENYWQERFHFTPETYFEKIITSTMSPNRVFATKLFWHQTENLMNKLADPDLFSEGSTDLLASYFPDVHYIWLKRNDKVRQAISFVRAEHTNQWWKHENVKKFPPRDADHPQGRFDFKEIDDFRIKLINWDVEWERYFRQRSITPLELVYEDIVQSYDATVLKILAWLNITLPANFKVTPPRLQKQADAVSEEWYVQYHEHFKKRYPQIPPIKGS